MNLLACFNSFLCAMMAKILSKLLKCGNECEMNVPINIVSVIVLSELYFGTGDLGGNVVIVQLEGRQFDWCIQY